MAKKFITIVREISRDIERNKKAQLKQAVLSDRHTKMIYREQIRANNKNIKEQKMMHCESRQAEVNEKNIKLNNYIQYLNSILQIGLKENLRLNFSSLKVKPAIPNFLHEKNEMREPQPLLWNDFKPSSPYWFLNLFPCIKLKFEKKLIEAQENFNQSLLSYKKNEELKKLEIERRQMEHQKLIDIEIKKAHEKNSPIDQFEESYKSFDKSSIELYCQIILEMSPYPEEFPVIVLTQYFSESKQLIISYELPKYENVVPKEKQFKYIKTNDEVTNTKATETSRKLLYNLIVSQIVLRSIHELFTSDFIDALETIVFNGYVSSIDPSNGQEKRPCLVSVRVSKDNFKEINLKNVDPNSCLKMLCANFSKSATELSPVRPILELDMNDRRFIQEEDILSSLDQRPNLMDLTPSEFESLITNLFQKMGLDTKQTQASRDGGVDCIAFDPRPIFGGKVIIQAKRYKNTVGVSSVRDLFGTMQNEGASKGILVSTSGYGAASFDFANGKPIELLSGANLLYLLKEYAGIDGKIIMPEKYHEEFST